jgi:hypothetical protein
MRSLKLLYEINDPAKKRQKDDRRQIVIDKILAPLAD